MGCSCCSSLLHASEEETNNSSEYITIPSLSRPFRLNNKVAHEWRDINSNTRNELFVAQHRIRFILDYYQSWLKNLNENRRQSLISASSAIHSSTYISVYKFIQSLPQYSIVHLLNDFHTILNDSNINNMINEENELIDGECNNQTLLNTISTSSTTNVMFFCTGNSCISLQRMEDYQKKRSMESLEDNYEMYQISTNMIMDNDGSEHILNTEISSQMLLDNIHCNIAHQSFIQNNRKKFKFCTDLKNEIYMNPMMTDLAQFNHTIGCPMEYWNHEKYDSFLEELMDNTIYNISREEYNILAIKAEFYLQTNEAKKLSQISVATHIISLLLFCNYFTLHLKYKQYLIQQWYKYNEGGNGSSMSIVAREISQWMQLLMECTIIPNEQMFSMSSNTITPPYSTNYSIVHSTVTSDDNISYIYHAFYDKIYFHQFCIQLNIPFSCSQNIEYMCDLIHTSSSNGIILQIVDAGYLNLGWISDIPVENERLICNHYLQFVNVTFLENKLLSDCNVIGLSANALIDDMRVFVSMEEYLMSLEVFQIFVEKIINHELEFEEEYQQKILKLLNICFMNKDGRIFHSVYICEILRRCCSFIWKSVHIEDIPEVILPELQLLLLKLCVKEQCDNSRKKA